MEAPDGFDHLANLNVNNHVPRYSRLSAYPARYAFALANLQTIEIIGGAVRRARAIRPALHMVAGSTPSRTSATGGASIMARSQRSRSSAKSLILRNACTGALSTVAGAQIAALEGDAFGRDRATRGA